MTHIPKYKSKRVEVYDKINEYIKIVKSNAGGYPWLNGATYFANKNPDKLYNGEKPLQAFHRIFSNTPIIFKPLNSDKTQLDVITEFADKYAVERSIDVLISNAKIQGLKAYEAHKKDVADEDTEGFELVPHYYKQLCSTYVCSEMLEVADVIQENFEDKTYIKPVVDVMPWESNLNNRCQVMPITNRMQDCYDIYD